jgi:hypothetical protein
MISSGYEGKGTLAERLRDTLAVHAQRHHREAATRDVAEDVRQQGDCRGAACIPGRENGHAR